MRLTLLLIGLTLLSSSCSLVPPKPTICIHVQESGYFRCKSLKTNDKFDLSYLQAERYICTPPDDYKEILDFLREAVRRSKLPIKDEGTFFGI